MNGRERLVQLVGKTRGHLAERAHARDVRELLAKRHALLDRFAALVRQASRSIRGGRDRDRVRDHQRQRGGDHRHGRGDIERHSCEQRGHADPCGHHERGAHEKPRAPADLVHAQHRDQQHARQERKPHQRDRDAPDSRIHEEMLPLRAVRIVAQPRPAPRDVRPHERMRRHQDPRRWGCGSLIKNSRDADETECQSEHSEAVDLVGT